MKNKHGLSGMYFRQTNVDTGKKESIAFEDLEPAEQDRILNDSSIGVEYYKDMIKTLADALYRVGEEFNIYSSMEQPSDD